MNAREEISRQARREPHATDGRLVLADLLSKLDVVESRWGELTALCDALPDTVVHGDLVPKNLRIMRDGRRTGLAVFDWETAGLGVQAPDLAQLLEPERIALARRQRSKRVDRFSANPCLDTYRAVLGTAAQDPDAVAQSAAIGNLFRCLAGIDWTCSQATNTWYPVEDFRVYSEWLAAAMREAGWDSPVLSVST